MFRSFSRNYYKFFDETFESSTFLVLIISFLICIASLLSPSVYAEPELFSAPENIIVIDGEEYIVEFQKVSK